MSASQGCIDDTAVVENFKEALKGRVGADRFRMWFNHGVEFSIQDNTQAEPELAPNATTVDRACRLLVHVRGQFAMDRLRKNFMQELRGAAMQACGSLVDVQICLSEPPAAQTELPLEQPGVDQTDASSPPINTSVSSASNCESSAPIGVAVGSKRNVALPRFRAGRRLGGRPASLSSLIASGAGRPSQRQPSSRSTVSRDRMESDLQQLELPSFGGTEGIDAKSSDTATSAASTSSTTAPPASIWKASEMTVASFVAGKSNQLAYTAMAMVCQNPGAASPLFLCGPTGTGKTHMLSAIADQFRRRHRMRRVMHLSAEQFTNDFITSVGNSGITSFRRRYREVDALLIDDVQFLGSKKATLREMLYTVETLAGSGRPLVFSGLQSPTEIAGLSGELAGRMAAGLVCSVQPLDTATRETMLRRWLEQRCVLEVPSAMITEINATLCGDGRVLSGVVNVINTLQRMYGRMPTMDELRQAAGDLLRSAAPIATLSVIESAVCEAFQLTSDTLRGGSQTRAVTEPRMLAMYLSRQLTSSAYAEIAKHFGGKSHSTAISAEHNVKSWLQTGKPIGRGRAAMSAQEAIDRVEGLLRSG